MVCEDSFFSWGNPKHHTAKAEYSPAQPASVYNANYLKPKTSQKTPYPIAGKSQLPAPSSRLWDSNLFGVITAVSALEPEPKLQEQIIKSSLSYLQPNPATAKKTPVPVPYNKETVMKEFKEGDKADKAPEAKEDIDYLELAKSQRDSATAGSDEFRFWNDIITQLNRFKVIKSTRVLTEAESANEFTLIEQIKSSLADLAPVVPIVEGVPPNLYTPPNEPIPREPTDEEREHARRVAEDEAEAQAEAQAEEEAQQGRIPIDQMTAKTQGIFRGLSDLSEQKFREGIAMNADEIKDWEKRIDSTQVQANLVWDEIDRLHEKRDELSEKIKANPPSRKLNRKYDSNLAELDNATQLYNNLNERLKNYQTRKPSPIYGLQYNDPSAPPSYQSHYSSPLFPSSSSSSSSSSPNIFFNPASFSTSWDPSKMASTWEPYMPSSSSSSLTPYVSSSSSSRSRPSERDFVNSLVSSQRIPESVYSPVAGFPNDDDEDTPILRYHSSQSGGLFTPPMVQTTTTTTVVSPIDEKQDTPLEQFDPELEQLPKDLEKKELIKNLDFKPLSKSAKPIDMRKDYAPYLLGEKTGKDKGLTQEQLRILVKTAGLSSGTSAFKSKALANLLFNNFIALKHYAEAGVDLKKENMSTLKELVDPKKKTLISVGLINKSGGK